MSKKSALFQKSILYIGILILFIISIITTGCCSKDVSNSQTASTPKETDTNQKEIEDPLGIGKTSPTQNSENDNQNKAELMQTDVKPKAKQKNKKSIGFMISPKGLDDKGFNEIAYRGLEEAEKKYQFETTIIEPSSLQDREETLRFFAALKFDAIIALGDHSAAVKSIAKENPQTKFYIIDSDIDEGNMKGVAFRDGEGAFLCGYLAGKLTKTNKVGFIGGTPCKVMDRFETGYKNGVKYANPEAEIIVEYIAKKPYDFTGFSNDTEGTKIGDSMYKSGIDIIFPACGSSALGVLDAAEANKKLVFGVDDNQDFLLPNYVVTSMIKRVDQVIVYIAESVCSGNKTNLQTSYGIAESALGLTDFKYSKGKTVSAKLIEEIEEIKKKITSGEINCMETAK